MSAVADAHGSVSVARVPFGPSAKSLGNGALWLAAFLSGFVIEEPAPYELYMAVLSVVWLACGLKLRREFGPLIICMMLYTAGGIASIPMAQEMGDAIMYIAVSGFLAITSIFYAAILADDPNRIRIIQNGYIVSAIFVATIGIAGYFHLFPGAAYFTLYDRARGTFQDPNVFGPFLVLPTVLLIHRLLRGPVFRNLHVVAGVLAVFALLAAALSIDTVSQMFEQRARLVQEYDGARLGRFARYALGFQLVMEHPLGIGALEFNKYFPEDEHNVYLKGFTTYGWLGGTVYIIMAIWTLCALVPLLFKARPWTGFTQCVFAVFVAHLILSVIIDTDHWRHMYMLYGLSWGLIAIDKLERKRFFGNRQAPLPATR